MVEKVAWKHLSFMCHDLLFWWGIFTAAGGPHGEGTISPLVKNWTNKNIYILLYLIFSHLADAFIQSDLQIRKRNTNYKLKL